MRERCCSTALTRRKIKCSLPILQFCFSFFLKLVLWTEVVLSVWYPREQQHRGKLPSLANTNLSVRAECSSSLQSVAKQAQICSSGSSPKSARSWRQRTTATYLKMYFADCLWPLLIELSAGCGVDKSPVSVFEESKWKAMPGILLLMK